MADMTSEARVVAPDRLWPGDIAGRGGDLLDVVFGWADFTRLRRLVAGQNVFYLRGLFNQVEAAGNNAFGIEMKAKPENR